jgi:hypothetical protein
VGTNSRLIWPTVPSATALSPHWPTPLMPHGIPAAPDTRWSWSLAYWVPRSECATTPAAGPRRGTATPRASTTSRLVIVALIARPTIRRPNRSATTARDSHPSSVGTYVKSAHHFPSGPAATKSRPSTFGATGGWCRESAVRTARRHVFARMPAARITCATVFTRPANPRAVNSACTRGRPYRPVASAWTSPIRAAGSARRAAAALGGRSRRA